MPKDTHILTIGSDSARSHPSDFPNAKAAKAVPRSWIVLLVASAALLVCWSFAVPIFEAPDEPGHWKYAHYIHEHHMLPIFSPQFSEAMHPPLYYALIAPIASATPEPPSAYKYNDDYSTKVTLRFPPRYFENAPGDLGRYRPIRAARLATVLISVFTVWFSCLAGTEASGNDMTGLLVGGLVAFLPQFTFRGMNVSGDALLTMCSAAALYLMVRIVRRGFSWGIGVLAALAIVGAVLSKVSAIFLPAPLALAIVLDKAAWRTKLIRVGVLGALVLVIVAPWFIRNQHLYGDLLARKEMYTVWARTMREGSLWSLHSAAGFFLPFLFSFIGRFGWMNVRLPRWAEVLYVGSLAVAGLCWIRGAKQRRIDRSLSFVLLSIVVLNLVTVIDLNLTVDSPQGRYMFPALPAIALLLGLGLESLRIWSRKLTWVTVGGWAVANFLVLVFVVIPAYWPPALR